MRKRFPISLLLWLIAIPIFGQPQAALVKSIKQAFRGRQGAVVILDVQTGKIVAAHDLTRAGQRLVRPGSAIKPFVLATLADSGVLAQSAKVHCSRQLNIAGHKLNCGHPDVASGMGAEEALAYSCNTYFTTMGSRLAPAQLRDGLLHWGLTSRSGVSANEAAGMVKLSEGRDQVALQSIGEQNIVVTPLGLLQGYLRLARERRATSTGGHAVVVRGLDASVEYGMARLAQPSLATFHVAGKTGTSMAAEGPWTHGWFAGYAPSNNPEIVLIVFLENGSGPTDAAPIARQIFEAWARERAR